MVYLKFQFKQGNNLTVETEERLAYSIIKGFADGSLNNQTVVSGKDWVIVLDQIQSINIVAPVPKYNPTTYIPPAKPVYSSMDYSCGGICNGNWVASGYLSCS